MSRIRELLAHGGIALLAIVFALAYAAFNLAVALAGEVVSVLQQQFAGEDGAGFYSFTVFDTRIMYLEALYYAIVLVILAAFLVAVWKLSRRDTRTCAECRSQVPAEASVCRFCTSELAPTADA